MAGTEFYLTRGIPRFRHSWEGLSSPCQHILLKFYSWPSHISITSAPNFCLLGGFISFTVATAVVPAGLHWDLFEYSSQKCCILVFPYNIYLLQKWYKNNGLLLFSVTTDRSVIMCQFTLLPCLFVYITVFIYPWQFSLSWQFFNVMSYVYSKFKLGDSGTFDHMPSTLEYVLQECIYYEINNSLPYGDSWQC